MKGTMTKTTAIAAIAEVAAHKDTILAGAARIHPGQPLSTESLSPGDVIAQGDLYIRVCGPSESPPSDYIRVDGPVGDRLKLVPGPDAGSHHWLDSGVGVTMFLPPEWGSDLESLRGPWLVLTEPRTIEHHGPSRHGSVHLSAGQCVELGYQRVWDAEHRRERRARD